MEKKIHYKISNSKKYDTLRGVFIVTLENFHLYQYIIQDSIDSFNSNIDWEDMWDVDEALKRLGRGDDLWIGVDTKGTLAHVWFNGNYLYNLYVDPRRPDDYPVKFVQFTMQFVPHDEITLYCDDWNIAAQKMFEKVGFEKYTPNK
jgi:hypothetical protein